MRNYRRNLGSLITGVVALALVSGAAARAEAPAAVAESARAIPIARDVDVVVVGGSGGAVAAAQSAARAGAKVYLVAPRPYLGDDTAATLRLWLEPGETPDSPLAAAIFASPPPTAPFTYQTDIRSGGKHVDTGTMLLDSAARSASHDSVEFAGDVVVTADLGAAKDVRGVELLAFQRAKDFAVQGVKLETAAEPGKWKPAGALKEKGDAGADGLMAFGADFTERVRYLRFSVAKKPGAPRMLLSKIVVKAPPPATGPGAMVPPTPLQVKRALDCALIASGVSYLTGCYATGVLRDGAGQPAGIVIADRSGRQAVRARVIVDATERAEVARMAGAQFRPYPGGPQTFSRVVIAGEPPAGAGMSVRAFPYPYDAHIRASSKTPTSRAPLVEGRMFECTLTIPMKDHSFAAFAAAEQTARDRTYGPTLLEGADALFQVPPDPVKGESSAAGPWAGAAQADLKCFRPAATPRVWVVGGCADLSREAAAQLLRPCALIALGARIGEAAAAEAKARPAPHDASLPAAAGAGAVSRGDVKEFLNGLRPYQTGLPTIAAGAQPLPVLGEYDVVVVGGGTGGAPAAIGAARQKARTLLIEYLPGLGGIGTLGMIGSYYCGNICGFTAEHDRGVAEMGGAVHVVVKAEWWRRECRRAGGEVWFGAMGCGALVEGQRVTGVVVATPQGRGVVLAKTVVDATGNSDIAAAAGAQTMFLGAEEIAVQGVGLSLIQLGASYINSDWGFVNDSDAADLWLFGVLGRAIGPRPWDVSQIVESRERRRIVGDFFLTPLDILNRRTFPDTIVRSKSNFDTHGYTIADVCLIGAPDAPRLLTADVPYRCLLPRGIEDVLVIGLGISAHRDAMPILRMQPDIQNHGYAAGVAAAMAVRAGCTPRAVDVRKLQEHLVQIGNLPEEVLGAKDSFPRPAAEVAAAVRSLADQYKGIGIVLAQAEEARPLLRQALAAARTPESKLIYAHVLGMLGDPAGAGELARAVAAGSWKREQVELTVLQFGRSVTPLDSYMIALGRTRDPRALAPILARAKELGPKPPRASHVRALTLACEALRDPAAAPVLAGLLQQPEYGGHARTAEGQILSAAPDADGPQQAGRTECLRELALARALYRCGDFEGLAERTLRQYAQDLRGVYALHATAVLAEKPGRK